MDYVTEAERTKRLIAMGEMAATLAHEIRNPLGSMELFCSLLQKDLATQPDQLYLAEQIHRGIRTLERVISNSLQFVRNSPPQWQKLPGAHALLHDVMDQVRPRAHAIGIEVELHLESDGELTVDRFQMHQVLVNVIVNAVEAIEAKFHLPEFHETEMPNPAIVVTSAVSENGTWTVIVKDFGIGISTEDEQRIFDPFFTKKDHGTGLGLSIVHSTIASHHGSTKIASIPNQGTTFTIVIPPLKGEGERV